MIIVWRLIQKEMVIHMRSKHAPQPQSDPFNLSISDLMAAMLAIFILALISVIIVYKEGADNLTRVNEQRSEVLTAIHNDLNQETKKKVILDEKNGILRIETDETSSNTDKLPKLGAEAVFNRGESKLTPTGESIVKDIGKSILAIKNDKKYESNWKVVDTIMIEGHTDSVPLQQGNRTNLDLSTERASYTWKFMDRNMDNALSKLHNFEGKKLFSIAGYGEQRPLLENDTTNGKNRRIEIRFIIKPVNSL